ncbi:MAG: hypothetical protein NUV54_01440 [Candidatus Taylorbacteria bacterium]|nr:hypothetical protein [Candidatus Taylorbacteria bacterium]
MPLCIQEISVGEEVEAEVVRIEAQDPPQVLRDSRLIGLAQALDLAKVHQLALRVVIRHIVNILLVQPADILRDHLLIEVVALVVLEVDDTEAEVADDLVVVPLVDNVLIFHVL